LAAVWPHTLGDAPAGVETLTVDMLPNTDTSSIVSPCDCALSRSRSVRSAAVCSSVLLSSTVNDDAPATPLAGSTLTFMSSESPSAATTPSTSAARSRLFCGCSPSGCTSALTPVTHIARSSGVAATKYSVFCWCPRSRPTTRNMTSSHRPVSPRSPPVLGVAASATKIFLPPRKLLSQDRTPCFDTRKYLMCAAPKPSFVSRVSVPPTVTAARHAVASLGSFADDGVVTGASRHADGSAERTSTTVTVLAPSCLVVTSVTDMPRDLHLESSAASRCFPPSASALEIFTKNELRRPVPATAGISTISISSSSRRA